VSNETASTVSSLAGLIAERFAQDAIALAKIVNNDRHIPRNLPISLLKRQLMKTYICPS
jgi:hypothetical protein